MFHSRSYNVYFMLTINNQCRLPRHARCFTFTVSFGPSVQTIRHFTFSLLSTTTEEGTFDLANTS